MGQILSIHTNDLWEPRVTSRSAIVDALAAKLITTALPQRSIKMTAETIETECACCYHTGPCFDDGEAYICIDRDACALRAEAAGRDWMERAHDPSPSEPSPDLDNDDGMPPLPNMRCSTCHDDGGLCWDCGSVDQPSIGRKIQYLMKNDRPTLLHILVGTPRRQWYLLAKSYVTAIGVEDTTQMIPMLGVVSLWGMPVKEAA